MKLRNKKSEKKWNEKIFRLQKTLSFTNTSLLTLVMAPFEHKSGTLVKTSETIKNEANGSVDSIAAFVMRMLWSYFI
jgi:ABC-type tungstate transport system permease subunit